MASLNDRIAAGTVDEITTPAAGQRVAVSEDGDPGDKYVDLSKFAAVSESLELTLTNEGSQNMNGTVYLQRVGNIVTVSTTSVSHDSDQAAANSGAGFIPSGYRPVTPARNNYTNVGNIRRFSVEPDGSIAFLYRDFNGDAQNLASTGTGACISYITTDAFPT